MKKLKKLSLKKEIEREAEALEKEVSGRKDLDHITVSEDMEEALFQKIQDYEYEKRAKIVYRKKKKRYAIIAVAAVFILVFGSVMTGVGSKSYWKEVWERDAEEGKISYIDVDEMPSQETEDIDEVQVYKEIRSELGILPVRLVYNTEGMVLKKYQINKELKKAILLYEKGNEVIKYTMYMSNIDSSFGQKEPDNLIDEYIVPLNNGVEVQVKEYEEKEEKIIRDVLLKANEERLRYKNKNNMNLVEITVQKNPHAMVLHTMLALIAAIVIGVLMKVFVPSGVNEALNNTIFTSISTMFLNALKMIVGPVVFFSIACCISQFGDLKEAGRIGGKVMGFYLLTTVLAILTATGVFELLKPGNPELAAKLAGDAATVSVSDVSISIKDTIVGIIPANFVKPFLDSNMMQLIFLAVLIGIALEKIGEHSRLLKDIFEACNDLFLKITVMLVRFIPVATFCSIVSVVLKTGPDVLLSMLAMLGTFAVGIVAMIIVYCILLGVIGRLNPIPFLKKYSPTMLQVFGMASSNAAIIVNMDACENKLGISKKIYSLSIPLGATVNMDGTCIYLVIFGMALARVFGVDINGGMMLSMFFSVFVLSVGAPGVPGAGLVCLSVLLTQLNVPLAGIGLVMGLDSLLGMMRAMSNSLGDVTASLIVAKSEKKLDMEKYMS